MANRSATPAFPRPEHNHGRCRDTVIARAEAQFERQGVKLTKLRRKVLEEIASSHDAVGAYDVLARLAAKGDRLAPISVYRALDALLAAGVIHRLESRNAFFACHAGHAPDRRQVVLACDSCGRVAEVADEAMFQSLHATLAGAGFTAHRTVVEVAGLCGHCAHAA